MRTSPALSETARSYSVALVLTVDGKTEHVAIPREARTEVLHRERCGEVGALQ